jgi:glycosyltransferase involved in cell wall biosynthesis
MHIAVNTLFMIPGEVGGTETYLREMLSSLARCQDVRQLTLVTQHENHSWFEETYGSSDKVRCVKLEFCATRRVRRILGEQLQLPGVVRRFGADLLWSPGYTAPLLKVGCPQVVTIHDMQYRRFPEDLSWSFRVASELLIPAAARRCDRVVTDSAFGKQEVVRYCRVPESKVSVVPAGCGGKFGHPITRERATECLAGVGLQHGAFILCVAYTHPHKHVHDLVDAFAELDHSALHLVLVGHPRRGESLIQKAIAEHQLADRVMRFDRVDFDLLLALYQACAAFVLPSRYEGFGLPVLEAMMAGAPVVTTRAASIPEVGGDYVIYTDSSGTSLTEGLREVLAWTPEERASRTQAARAHAAKFSWQRAGEQLCRVFRSVLSGRE